MVKSLYNIQLTNNTWNLRSKPTINWDLPKDNIIYVESSWLFEDNVKVKMVKLKGLMYDNIKLWALQSLKQHDANQSNYQELDG